ncbi:MAG: hypothetical protein O2800_01960 [Planctomycetota bacterium]|nr:hypothetical protein [Planctomycetota bacterium]
MRGFWTIIALTVIAGTVWWWMDAPSDEPIAQVATFEVEPSAPIVAPSVVVPPLPVIVKDTTAPAPSNAIGPLLDLGMDIVIPTATVIQGSIHTHAKGGIDADGRFHIRGKGTETEPYEITWELLTSVEDNYVPRLSMMEIPQRIAMLQGAWVRVSGYIAFPLVAIESDELLLMLNQWDGCCIGVPPSPYDAIETRLSSAIEVGARHQIQYATVKGRLKVDPYVVDKWLVGLYLMEDASISTEM